MKRLFVGNLPYSAHESELVDWFTQAGISIDTISFIRDRASGESRGFGFVEIKSDDEADRAIQSCNGKDFLGRTLIVNEARPIDNTRGRQSTNASWGNRARSARW